MTKMNLTSLSLTVSLAAGLLAFGCESEEARGDEPAAAEEQAEEQAPKRIAVEVHDSGYDPDRIVVEAGKPVTLAFTRTTDEGCGDVLSIPDLDIRKDLPLNEAVEVAFTPEKTGEMTVTCGMDMYKGAIVVR